MKVIQATYKGVLYEVKVDDCDFERISQYRWILGGSSIDKRPYARRDRWANGRKKSVSMHREIMGDIPKGLCVDHINGDTLDNRRCNLRLATLSQNNANTGLCKKNATGFKGVVFHKKRKKWDVRLSFMGKRLHIGTFTNPQEAARAYDVAAIKHFGAYARTNAMIQEEAKNG